MRWHRSDVGYRKRSDYTLTRTELRLLLKLKKEEEEEEEKPMSRYC